MPVLVPSCSVILLDTLKWEEQDCLFSRPLGRGGNGKSYVVKSRGMKGGGGLGAGLGVGELSQKRVDSSRAERERVG